VGWLRIEGRTREAIVPWKEDESAEMAFGFGGKESVLETLASLGLGKKGWNVGKRGRGEWVRGGRWERGGR
jgi:hypothetical protein